MKLRTLPAHAGMWLLVAAALAAGPASAACINPLTNLVDDVNDCLFADKNDKACRLAFALDDFDGAGNPPADPKKIACVDGDPCDADGFANGVCTFRVGVCLNATVAGCAAAAIDSVEIKKPKLKDTLNAIKRPQAVFIRRTLVDATGSIVPTAAEACTDSELLIKVPIAKEKKGVCAAPAGAKCATDRDCDDYCIGGVKKKGKDKLQLAALDSDGKKVDSDSLKLTCLRADILGGARGPATTPAAEARQVVDSADLVGGPLAMGELDDYILQNGNIAAVIRDIGRIDSFALLNGGQIIDADLQRLDPADDRDNWLGIQPLIHISSTQGTDTISVINDGTDGAPAIIRSSGPDDLFDTINPSVLVSAQPGTAIPDSAQDVDLPVAIATDFVLGFDRNYILMNTTVTDTGGSDLDLFIGDFMNPGGQLEAFGPGLGYGEPLLRNGRFSPSKPGLSLDYMAFQGRGEAEGVTYGVVFPPNLLDSSLRTSAFTQSGVVAWANRQDLFNLLFSGSGAPSFEVPANGENNLRRWFVVGESVADVTKARIDIYGIDHGALQGFVTVAGAPSAGAHVTVINEQVNNEGATACETATSAGNCWGVVSSTRTDAAGFYRIWLPEGDYQVVVRANGAPYAGGGATPQQDAFTIKKKKTAIHDIDLPEAATLTVNVVDQDGAPIAGKVSVVGLQSNADPLSTELVGGLGIPFSGRLFGEVTAEKGGLPYGLTDVRFADTSGATGTFEIPPGDYNVVVSHGFEYDVYSEPITLVAGDDGVVNATVNQVVDTSGFVSLDAHVHMLNSPDSAVPREDRILTMLAEGVDSFANTDHDFVHSLGDEVAAMGVGSLIKTMAGQEITTSDKGHFNVWPLDPVPAFNPAIPATRAGSPVDWGRTTGYPSGGSYDLAPGEIFAAAAAFPGVQTVAINHFNSGTLGHFNLLGIDTQAVPPTSSNNAYQCVGGTRDSQPCEVQLCSGGANDGNSCTVNGNCPGGTCPGIGFGRDCTGGTCTNTGNLAGLLRLDPAETNLFDDGFTALEVWIEASRAQTALLLGENLADWVNLLNQGIFKAGVSNSDTHQSATVQAGGPRTYIASSTDAPGSIDPDEISANVNGLRAIGSGGPFLRVTLNGDGGTANHAVGSDMTVNASGGGAESIDIHVEAPTWAEFDTIDVYLNTAPTCKSQFTFFGVVNPSQCSISPDVTLTAGVDFAVNTVDGIHGPGKGSRLVADVNVALGPVASDTWVIVVARGTDGNSAPLFPMNPQDLLTTANTSLADLTDGGGALPWNNGESGQLALAYSNPLFFDAEGDGFCHGGTACP